MKLLLKRKWGCWKEDLDLKMRKRNLLLFVFAVLCFVFNMFSVNAANLSREWLDNTYGIFIYDDYYSFGGEIYRMDGKIAYCLQPGKKILTSDYNATADMEITDLTDQQIKQIELIAYYGYGYSGHTDPKYYLAAQEMIWELIFDNSESYWTITQDVHGIKIDIEKEKREINNLIASHNKKPSFDGNKVVGKIGETIEIEDKNGVLANYEIVGNATNYAKIDGNKLVIEVPSDTFSLDTIQLVKKQYTDDVVLLYFYGESQMMISTGKVDNVISNVKIDVTGGKFEVHKKGENLIIEDGNYKYEKISLGGVKFELYANEDIVTSDGILRYAKGELVNSYVTDENGYVSDNLYLGSYCIREIASTNNNVVDEREHCFELTDNGDVIPSFELDLENYWPKGRLEFYKGDLVSKVGIPNTWIEIYTVDGDLVYSGKTDEKGMIVIDNLFVGKFYLIEKEAADGYKKTNDKVYFEIVNNGQVVETSLMNEQIKVPETGKSDMDGVLVLLMGMMVLGYVGYAIIKKKNG